MFKYIFYTETLRVVVIAQSEEEAFKLIKQLGHEIESYTVNKQRIKPEVVSVNVISRRDEDW